ncbi:P-loop containing nucleoside triphosphate hydrolase protein [Annulohypoxylon truncatum]|uniref:P-loop containing nucleoside triphosphate hydrolase protein n=1 Tax=Annulohypoxylon truncatum TaxID=327061 RepID=UPI002007AEDB|nr:P-loop containing nucleoside triphosphate hydrolase protein [Annulohypoxylon truncatum]KAI1206716.1 P-loop containing nucleoside triphosphate hydrolase protein [Annulohypoxylon truncatum]
MAPFLKPDVDNDEDDSQSCTSGDCSIYSSSISSSPSICVSMDSASTLKPSNSTQFNTKPQPLKEKNEGTGTQNTHGDCTKDVTSTISDTTKQIECDMVRPRFHYRSRSAPGFPHSIPPDGPTTMIDEVNDLKSFYQTWKKYAVTEDPEPDAIKDEKDELETFPTDDAFVFPFFHLDSSNFGFHKYPFRFPFFHLDPSIFDARRRRIIFPFSHLAPSLFECEPRSMRKPGSPLEKLMKMIGLEEVKKEFLSVRDRVKAAKARKEMPPSRSLKLDLIITGNSGTGRSTIANIYRDYLYFLGIGPVCTSMDGRQNDSYRQMERMMRHPMSSFLVRGLPDDLSDYSYDPYRINGRNDQDSILVVDTDNEKLKGIFSQPEAHGRFSRRLNLKDYTDDELLAILICLLKKDSLKVKGGFDAPFLRMFARKVGHGRGQNNYKNVNTLKDEIKKVLHRRAERLEKATQGETNMIVGIHNRSYDLTESDFFGNPPIDIYKESEAWKKLEKMAGMEKIKNTIKGLISRRNMNYTHERAGEKPLKTSHNYVFLGPPGTGKTTVAALFGQIIAELGFIDSSEVVLKTPSNFLGKYVGHSEDETRKILEETEGKTLIIDEAHMFYHGSEYGTDKSDIFRKGIVDTIVAHVDNEPGNNRCIILAGYPDRMKEFYRNTNPGFQRRFPLEDAFVFENYDVKTLSNILDIMLGQDGIMATDEAKSVAMEILQRERELPNFGNGGAVRNLISRALALYNNRTSSISREHQDADSETSRIVLEPRDFDPEYDRGLRNQKDYRSLFKDLVGFQDIISVFQGYQTMTANMLQYGLDPREEVPFSFVFKGPPGTGKTTTARALGQIYYSMGLLSTTEVMDCSVTDLVGTGTGLTGPKVQNLLERALGKVLFVDEAYRMGQTDLAGVFINRFAQEAVGELVDCMTKERFAHKLVIVLAGYEADMDKLMATNEGLRGRFTEMVFPNMRPKDCLRLLQKKLENKKIRILGPRKQGSLDKVVDLFESLSGTEAWANARDVETISKRIIRLVFMKKLPAGEHAEFALEEVAAVLKQLLRERGG